MKEIDVKKETIRNLLQAYRIEIPTFQRRFKWNKEKKEQLILSLIKNYPIGAITLYETIDYSNTLDKDKPSYKYLVVDGLQRIFTIKQYIECPSSIIDLDDYLILIKSNLENLSNDFNLSYRLLKKAISNWYVSLTKEFLYEDFEILYSMLESEFQNNHISYSVFQKIRNIVLEPLTIINNHIGLIFYYGDEDSLPDLFTKINQKSVSLTPYEILHSLWFGYRLNIDTFKYNYYDHFIKMIEENKNYVVDVSNIDDFNIYMLLSSLGYFIWKSENTEIFDYFKDNNAKFSVPEVSFDIFSTIGKGVYNKAHSALMKLDFNSPFINDFLLKLSNAILETSHEANRIIFDAKELPRSRFHYVYLVYGIFLSRYFCSFSELTFYKRDTQIQKLYDYAIDLRKQIKDGWFVDANRQVTFFRNQVKNLASLESSLTITTESIDVDNFDLE